MAEKMPSDQICKGERQEVCRPRASQRQHDTTRAPSILISAELWQAFAGSQNQKANLLRWQPASFI